MRHKARVGQGEEMTGNSNDKTSDEEMNADKRRWGEMS